MDFFTNNPLSIERAVLSTYVFVDFYSDILNPPSMPRLDEKLFSIQIHKSIARKINKAIDEEESISMACFEIQDKIGNTRYEQEWLEILASNALPFNTLKSYFKLLTKIRIKNDYRR